jgi:hypothetical protein
MRIPCVHGNILIAAVAALATLPAAAQSLWANTKYGMTIDEVRAAQPAAVVAPRLPADGEPGELLRVPSFELAGERFVARLFFANGRLDGVQLTPVEHLKTGAAESARERLLAALRAKYGQEVLNTVEPGPIAIDRTAKWSAGGATVTLRMMTVGSQPTSWLVVSYSAEIAKDASKL